MLLQRTYRHPFSLKQIRHILYFLYVETGIYFKCLIHQQEISGEKLFLRFDPVAVQFIHFRIMENRNGTGYIHFRSLQKTDDLMLQKLLYAFHSAFTEFSDMSVFLLSPEPHNQTDQPILVVIFGRRNHQTLFSAYFTQVKCRHLFQFTLSVGMFLRHSLTGIQGISIPAHAFSHLFPLPHILILISASPPLPPALPLLQFRPGQLPSFYQFRRPAPSDPAAYRRPGPHDKR